MTEPNLIGSLASLGPDCLVILSALASLGFVYTLVVLLKNRYTTAASSSSSAWLQSTAGPRRPLCRACEHSNLNCRIIYNRLVAGAQQHFTCDSNNGPSKGPTALCAHCGGQLMQDEGGKRNLDWPSARTYGKVEGQQKLNLHQNQSKQQVAPSSSRPPPPVHPVPSGGPGDAPAAGQQLARPLPRTASGTNLSRWSSLLELPGANEPGRQKRKRSECTGVAFDPIDPLNLLDQQASRERPLAADLPVPATGEEQNSISSTPSLLCSTVETESSSWSQDEASDSAGEPGEQRRSGGAGGGGDSPASGRFRWMRGMKKLLRAQRIVTILSEASKQVSAELSRRTGAGSLPAKLADSNKTLEPIDLAAASPGPGGRCSLASSAQQMDEEPEFLSSRKLRSADIKIPMEPFNDSNTSEFDCGPEWDSRQDTSLDYNMANRCWAPHPGAPAPECSPVESALGGNESANGDAVMDSDLRQASRLNLELLLLQNAAQNLLSTPGSGDSPGLGRWNARSRSLTGASGIPQSGTLPAASQQQGHHHHGHHHHHQSYTLPARAHLVKSASSQVDEPLSASELLPGAISPTTVRRRPSFGSGGAIQQSKSRTNSEHDSGIVPDSRKSSIAAVNTTTTTNTAALHHHQVPVLRLQIRQLGPISAAPIISGSECLAASGTPTPPARPRLLSSLAHSLKGPSGTSCSVRGAGSAEPTEESAAWWAWRSQVGGADTGTTEQLFEVRLLEVRNVPRHAQQSSCQSPDWISGSGHAPAGCGNPSGPADSGSLGLLGVRRDSLLGALVAAATPSSPRRASIEGVFARVFKQQPAGSGGGGNVEHSINNQQQQHSDSVSLHSSTSLVSTVSGASTCECMQLPLVRLAAMGEQQLGWQLEGSLSFQDSSGYAFACRQSEFPLRISLYQVSKRGGARCTLGHCFVSLADLRPAAAAAKRGSDQVSRTSSSSGASEQSAAPAGARQLAASSGLVGSPQEAGSYLEYRLYQTILEAMAQ